MSLGGPKKFCVGFADSNHSSLPLILLYIGSLLDSPAASKAAIMPEKGINCKDATRGRHFWQAKQGKPCSFHWNHHSWPSIDPSMGCVQINLLLKGTLGQPSPSFCPPPRAMGSWIQEAAQLLLGVFSLAGWGGLGAAGTGQHSQGLCSCSPPVPLKQRWIRSHSNPRGLPFRRVPSHPTLSLTGQEPPLKPILMTSLLLV